MPDPKPVKYGITKHRPVRRRTSLGACDLCGLPLEETEVHTTSSQIDVDHTEGSIARHVNEYFDRNDDGTLASRVDDAIDVDPVERKTLELPPKAGG